MESPSPSQVLDVINQKVVQKGKDGNEAHSARQRLSVQTDFPSVNLCAYPFLLNAQAKTTMLQTDAELQMQVPAKKDQVFI